MMNGRQGCRSGIVNSKAQRISWGGGENYSVGYCSSGYMTLCICKNPGFHRTKNEPHFQKIILEVNESHPGSPHLSNSCHASF